MQKKKILKCSLTSDDTIQKYVKYFVLWTNVH